MTQHDKLIALCLAWAFATALRNPFFNNKKLNMVLFVLLVTASMLWLFR